MKKNSSKFIFISLLVLFLSGTLSAGNLSKEIDTDQNGIEDSWEIKYFGALLGTNINSDSDNDGFSNYTEYLSNTNPKDSGSKPVANSVISYEYDSIGRIKKITRNAQ